MKIFTKTATNVPNAISSLLYSNGDDSMRALEKTRRRVVSSLFLVIGVLIVFPFCIFHFSQGNTLRAAILLFFGSVQATSLIILRYLKETSVVIRTNVILLGCYLLVLIVIGGTHGARILWVFVFPPYAFFLLGKKEGLFWSSIILLFSWVLFIDPGTIFGTFSYHSTVKLRFSITYAILILMSYILEATRQRYQQGMEKESLSLQSEIKKSLRIEEALRKATDDLEKRAETSLREAYEIINKSPAVAFLWRNEEGWPVEFVSDNVETLFGYSVDDLLSGRVLYSQTVHPDDLDRVAKEIADFGAQDGRQTFTHEPYRIVTKSGETKYVYDNTTIRRDDKGEVTHYQGIVEDITERLQAEMALQESEEKYRNILESIREGYIESDLAGNFTFVSDRECEMVGYSRDELVGMNFRSLVAAETIQVMYGAVQDMLRSGKGELLADYEVIRKDGGKRIHELSLSLIQDASDEPVGIRGVARDITELREAEIERKRLEEKLQNAQKMEAIGTLAGGIAHDFNNLLMSIQGNATLMIMDKDSNHPDFERVKNIEHAVKSGAELTKQLLGFARLGKYESKPTDLNELIERSCRMFGRTRKEIKIHEKYQKDPWPAEVDPVQIEQVLLNLYVNAWQAMPGGGELYVGTENIVVAESFMKPYEVKPGKYVKVSVTDTGVGMDEETLPRIFDPFFTTKEIGRGTGLGLSSTYGIIKNHGGFIDVYSEKDEGTTFNVYLPASEKKIVEDGKLLEDVLKGSERILLVDDDEMILDAGRKVLEKTGYTVLTAKTGKEALNIFEKQKDQIDLVILDMIMPDIGGGKTYDRLKEINPDIKVLLCSGYSINGQAQKILDRGCNGFIQKPFDLNELSLRIREILDKR